MIVVQKFGGSSLADLNRLRRAAQRCIARKQEGHALAVVVSAMGESTDELLRLARQITPSPSARELDALLGTGEQRSAALFAILLESLGYSAVSFSGWQAGIFTRGEHGDSEIALLLPERLLECFERGQIAVVCGFQGLDAAGDLTTLGRGGSDTTAVALASALHAGRCEIYSDVRGVYTADPRRLRQARLLPEIDFRDMLALSRAGAQVLHDRSVALAMANGTELSLFSSMVEEPGTLVRTVPDKRRPGLTGVTEREGRVTLVGKDADAAALSRLVLALGENGVEALRGGLEENAVWVETGPSEAQAALFTAHSLVTAALKSA